MVDKIRKGTCAVQLGLGQPFEEFLVTADFDVAQVRAAKYPVDVGVNESNDSGTERFIRLVLRKQNLRRKIRKQG